jgi:hypothetical protein
MSVVFSFGLQNSPTGSYALANDGGVIPLKIRSQARENFYGAACRLKLKYHRHEVGGFPNDN